MARKPRENIRDGVYHVYARGVARGRLFEDDVDRRIYLRRLAKVVSACSWELLAYCLMTTHVHLLAGTPHANLSEGMRRLHGGYAQELNGRHRRSGHVFEGRYGAVRMESSNQVCVTAAYIARNPLEAGLCSQPEDWPWSSYGFGFRSPRPRWLAVEQLLMHFDADPGTAWRHYEQMTLARAGEAAAGT